MKMFNKAKNKFLIIIIIACFVLAGLFYYFLNKNISKIDISKDYVYSNEIYGTDEDGYIEVPKINLKGEKIDRINKLIKDNYDSISRLEEYDYNYEYSISKNILALKIEYAYFEDNNLYEATRSFQTIHIDLKNGNILSDDDILKMYNINKEYINSYLETKFNTYYNDLVEGKFYTKEECNYECFLNNRGITTNYSDNVSYYIQDGVLTLFKFYYSASDYLEQQYFNDENYQFIIKE